MRSARSYLNASDQSSRRVTYNTLRPAERLLTSSLKPAASSPKKQEKDHNQQNDAEAATPVVTKAGAHVVAASPEEQEKDHENDY
jgi:hypothetical protein